MADNVTITAGTGTTIATDDIGGVQHQRVKLVLGPDGTATADAAGRVVSGSDGAMYVDQRAKLVRLPATPSVSNGAVYAAKDCVGSYMTFANAVRFSGGSGTLVRVQVEDKGQQMKDLELVLIDSDISGTSTATDNAIWAPVDGDVDNIVGVIPISAGAYADFSTNSVADVPCAASFVLAGTSLYAVLIARGTPTYTSTSDIIVTLTIAQD